MILAKLLFWIRMRWGWLPKPPHKPVLPYAKIQTVGLLLDDNIHNAADLLDKLQADGKSVHTLRYFPPAMTKALPQLTANEQRHSFSAQALNSWGLLNNGAIQHFLAEEYDLLINTSLKTCLYLEQIHLRAQARLKIGICPQKLLKPGYQLLVRSKQQQKGLAYAYQYLQHL